MTARRAPRTSAKPAPDTSQRDRLLELADALHPGLSRARGLAELDRMYRAGSPPDPVPQGFLPGRLLVTQTWGPLDGMVQRLARAWMPWQGKSFDADSSTGVNRFVPLAGVRPGFRIMFPGYRLITDSGERMEAFEFRNRLDMGAADPELKVYKIDYDLDANPRLIRRILDELVQVGEGVYLGRILLRVGRSLRPMGFFMLEHWAPPPGSGP